MAGCTVGSLRVRSEKLNKIAFEKKRFDGKIDMPKYYSKEVQNLVTFFS